MTRTVVFLLALAGAAVATEYDVVTLETPAKIDYRVQRDLTGDGIADLLIVSAREARFWRGRAGTLPRKPDRVFALPEGAALFDFGRPRATEEEEMIVRTHDTYWALGVTKDVRTRLAMTSGPGLPRAPANVLWRGFFRDLNLDKRDDFVDVSLDGYRIRYGESDETLLPPQINETCKTVGTAVSARRVARYGLGAWTAGNFNGDLRPDFAVETERGLIVYSGDGKGRFDAARRLEIAIPEAKDADISYVDLNRDGQTDVLAVRRKAGKAVILMASPTKGLFEAHRFELSVAGNMRYPVLTDLDGDHLPDLALPYVPPPSLGDAVRVLARGEFVVKVPIFLNRGGRRPFSATSDARLSLPVRVRMAADPTGRLKLSGLIIVEYGGDLDGDGRKDLVVTEQTDRLAVYRGVPMTVFRDEVWKHLEIPDCAAYDSVYSTAADLNGDKRSDIILHYRGGGRRPDRVHVLLSRKN